MEQAKETVRAVCIKSRGCRSYTPNNWKKV